MHWKAWRRLLVFRSGDLGQHSSIISWRAFIYEEGAPSGLTVSFLERVLAIRTERYQLQSIHSSRTSHSCGGDSLSDFSVAFQSRSGS
jgi:hypothetical protein